MDLKERGRGVSLDAKASARQVKKANYTLKRMGGGNRSGEGWLGENCLRKNAEMILGGVLYRYTQTAMNIPRMNM